MADQQSEGAEDRYATIAAAFLGRVSQRLQSLEPKDLSAADVAQWTTVAIKLQQAAQLNRSRGYDRQARLTSMTQTDDPETSQRALLDDDFPNANRTEAE